MAQPIVSFSVVEVGKPNIGEKQPSRVRADVVVNLNVPRNIKAEWEALRKHDVCFLVTVKSKAPISTRYNYRQPFIPQVGLTFVRGCEIEGMLDDNGRVIEEGILSALSKQQSFFFLGESCTLKVESFGGEFTCI